MEHVPEHVQEHVGMDVSPLAIMDAIRNVTDQDKNKSEIKWI